MNLLSSLNSGFPAAANGTAKIFIRGSSTRATVYGDFEASTSDSSGADLALDAYGSREVYVNQLVDVEVYDEDGVLIRDYTDGYSSPNVELISPAFTGTDYVTAISAVSEPTTVQAVLDRWITNAGAPDWKVLLNGVSTTMLNAFGALSGLVFNVKSPAYGAVGDGVTNDQSAIQAALAAAVAAGGGIVFFPKGTYLTTTAMEWDTRVALVGAGPAVSVITTNSAANARIIQWTAATSTTSPCVIHGVGFSASQANTGSQIYSTVAVNLLIDTCRLGASSNCTGTMITLAGDSILQIRNSRITVYSTVNPAWTVSATTRTNVTDCLIETGDATYNGSLIKTAGRTTMTGVRLDFSSDTLSVPSYGIEVLNAGDWMILNGVEIYSTSQSPNYGVRAVNGSRLFISGCYLQGVTGAYSIAALTDLCGTGSNLENTDTYRKADATGAVTLPLGGFAIYEIDCSNAAGLVVTMPAILFRGNQILVIIKNSSGSNWSPTLSGVLGAGVTINAGTTAYIRVVVADISVAGTWRWNYS